MKTIRDVFLALACACLFLGPVMSIIVEVELYTGSHSLASTAVPAIAPPKKIDVSQFDQPGELVFPEDRRREWSKPGMDDVIPSPNLPKVMINPTPAKASPTPAPTPAPSSTNKPRRAEPTGRPRMA